MSIGSLGGVVGSAAGAPLSQTKGTEAERAQRETTAAERGTDSAERSERAAGIGQTGEDQETSERDADGRRPWEAAGRPAAAGDRSAPPRQSKDASGDAGTQLDLTG
jgi:hypothetical protein